MWEGSMTVAQDITPHPTFEWVFSTYHTLVYRLAYALLGHAQDAEDVTQEVFLRVYKALPRYEPERASLRTWITQVTVNACQSQRRRRILQRWWQPLPDADSALAERIFPDPSPWVAPEDQALRAEVRRILQSELAQLRPEHRVVLILYYYLEYSCAEIAQITNASEGTVCSRLYYARRRLQARLEALPVAPGQKEQQ